MKTVFRLIKQSRHVYFYKTFLFILFIFLLNYLTTTTRGLPKGHDTYLRIPTRDIHSGSEEKYLETARSLTFFKPIEPLIINEVWNVANDPSYEIYFYAAIYDDRDGLATPAVRVTGIIQEGVEYITCLLWYRKVAKPDVVLATKLHIGDSLKQQDKVFSPVLLSCETIKGRWPPDYVSVVTAHSLAPSNLLPVVKPGIPTTPKDFLVCVNLQSELPEPKIVLEWLILMKLFQVDTVAIYDNGLPLKVKEVIHEFTSDGFIQLHKAPNCVTAEHNMSSLSAPIMINDCMYRNMYRYNMVSVLNFNQLIIPRGQKSYYELLLKIESEIKKAKSGLSYIFQNADFYLDLPPFEETFSHFGQYLSRATISPPHHKSSSFTDPKLCLTIGEATCLDVLPSAIKTNWKIYINETLALSHRYEKCKLDKEFNSPGLCNKTMTHEVVTDQAALAFMDDIYRKMPNIAFRLQIPLDFKDDFLNDENDQDAALEETDRNEVERPPMEHDGNKTESAKTESAKTNKSSTNTSLNVMSQAAA